MASDERPVPATDPHGAAAPPRAADEAERAAAAVSRRRRLRPSSSASSARSTASRSDPTADEIWDVVELARHDKRPYTLDYVELLFDDFFELHGDRSNVDDEALVAGLGRFDGQTVALVGHQKGRDVHERTRRNFGMASPEGYRKAIRVIDLADRHGFPVLSLIDTPGAYPGVQAEQHGQGGWIARWQLAMLRLATPTVACVIGEGGSGGAVAIAVADRVLMQENAIYSVISPEGCASILWRDAGEKKKAAGGASSPTRSTASSSRSSTRSSRSRRTGPRTTRSGRPSCSADRFGRLWRRCRARSPGAKTPAPCEISLHRRVCGSRARVGRGQTCPGPVRNATSNEVSTGSTGLSPDGSETVKHG